MNAEQTQNIAYQKAIQQLRHGYTAKGHNLKIDLMKLRHKLTTEHIHLRDKVAVTRHNERLEIIEQK